MCFLKKVTELALCQYYLLMPMFTCFVSQSIKEEKKLDPPSFSPSLAPLFYLTERDDRRSGVSVNRTKRWRDGKMDSF